MSRALFVGFVAQNEDDLERAPSRRRGEWESPKHPLDARHGPTCRLFMDPSNFHDPTAWRDMNAYERACVSLAIAKREGASHHL